MHGQSNESMHPSRLIDAAGRHQTKKDAPHAEEGHPFWF